jgi:hypothetical protein
MKRSISRRSRGLLAIVSLLAPLVLAGCGNVIDDDQLETEIRNGVQTQAGVNLTEVTCPESRPIQAGDVFTCTATADDGRTLEITVTQNDDQGNVRWEVTGTNVPGQSP